MERNYSTSIIRIEIMAVLSAIVLTFLLMWLADAYIAAKMLTRLTGDDVKTYQVMWQDVVRLYENITRK